MTPHHSDNGGIAITILGSGTCVPSLTRSSCSVLMEIGDRKLLFDAGAGTIRQLLETGTSIYDISHVFFSHFHPDHTGELIPFLFSRKYADPSHRDTPLALVAGHGFSRFFRGLIDVYGELLDGERGMPTLHELDNSAPDSFRSDGFSVASLPMEHSKESIGFRVTAPGGGSVVYSGDTDVCSNLVTLAENVDLLICESSFPDELKKKGHLTPSQAGDIATRAKVGNMILTHLYPECDTVDIEKQCRKTYGGPLAVAEDLMKIVV